MSEMREYQQKLLNSDKKIVMCNWERGNGKTHAIMQKILQSEGNWVFITNTVHSKQNLMYDKISQALKSYGKGFVLETRGNMIALTFVCEKKIHIYFENANTFRYGIKYDYVVFDDEIVDIEVIRQAKTIRGLKQIIIATTDEDFEYIDDGNNLTIDKENWIEQQIKELMIEFSNISKNERTTMTREKILGMIKQLESMRIE